ncbi:MAG: hypothetical protein ACKVP5_20860 [Aestuariivirga sp.]
MVKPEVVVLVVYLRALPLRLLILLYKIKSTAASELALALGSGISTSAPVSRAAIR